MTEIVKLINNVETLFTVFVPGALCVWCYSKLALKRIETQGYFILSIAIGFSIKYIIDNSRSVLAIINPNMNNFPALLSYIVFGLFLAIIYYKVKNSIVIRKTASRLFGIETGDNIWTRHIDFKNRTDVLVYLDDGQYVVGKIENVDDDYMVLTYHATSDEKSGKKMTDAVMHPIKSALCIPMSRVKRFEFLYENPNSDTAKFVLK